MDFLGVKLNAVTKDQLVSIVRSSLVSDDSRLKIYTPNPEFIIETRRNKNFLEVLNRADINIVDGIGLLWGASFLALPNRFRFFIYLRYIYTFWQLFYSLLGLLIFPGFSKNIIPEKISGSDFFWDLVKICASEKRSLFLLGAEPGVAERVRSKVLDIYPNIRICGTYAGSPEKIYEDEICRIIEHAKADVLMVAYGAPAQEMWIDRNINKISSLKIAIGLGGTFDFVSGKAKRAPYIMRQMGLEWLFRLFWYPSRIFRIYNATIKFIILVLKEKLKYTK